MTKNRLKLGLGVLTVLATPIAVNTVASSDALAAQGWVKTGTSWYFYNQNGTLARNAWSGNYWLGADGKMVTNAWVDNGRYYVGADGAWVKGAQKPATPKPAVAQKQGWVKEGNAWYYFENGTVARNKWIGSTYWVGADGKMATSSWVDNGRYYVGSNGAWVKDAKKPEAPKPVEKKQGWVKEGNTWYYYNQGIMVRNAWQGNYWLGSDGKMATSAWVDNGRYYVGVNGAWVKDAKKPEETKPVEKKQGWEKEGTAWYYHHQGQIVKNAWVGSYWLGSDGKMATSAWVDNGRYYVGPNGVWDKNAKKPEETKPVEKKQGWKKEDNAWYYYDNGEVARNKWIGDTYWVGKDGKMVTENWVDNDRFYVDKTGKKDPSIKKKVIINDELGWQKRNGGEWYYYEKDGSLARNKWVGNYWLGADGKMAKSAWVDNGRYYVDSSGKWVPNYAKADKNTAALNMPQYYQGDYRWANRRYGLGTMAQSGCVPTSLAMVFNGLGQKVLPTAVADTIYNNTNEMNVGGLGTSGKGAVYAINAYGYKHTVITTREQLIAALQSGKPVFATVGNGIFAKGRLTHAIILSGYSNGKTKAMDPDSAYNTGKWYDINTIWNQRSTDPYDTNIGGSFVAIG
ncbi:MAG: C39 family peptidase [Staphylococcus sp.]|nr:C39 family peptidase [Staphylococcus sp.]